MFPCVFMHLRPTTHALDSQRSFSLICAFSTSFTQKAPFRQFLAQRHVFSPRHMHFTITSISRHPLLTILSTSDCFPLQHVNCLYFPYFISFFTTSIILFLKFIFEPLHTFSNAYHLFLNTTAHF